MPKCSLNRFLKIVFSTTTFATSSKVCLAFVCTLHFQEAPSTMHLLTSTGATTRARGTYIHLFYQHFFFLRYQLYCKLQQWWFVYPWKLAEHKPSSVRSNCIVQFYASYTHASQILRRRPGLGLIEYSPQPWVLLCIAYNILLDESTHSK